jgi:hypothetical protein
MVFLLLVDAKQNRSGTVSGPCEARKSPRVAPQIADLVREQEHQAGVERGALGVGQSFVRGDEGGVEAVGVGDVGIGQHSSGQSAVGSWQRARLSIASA